MAYQIIRPILFQFDPEKIHGVTVQLMRLAGTFPPLGRLLSYLFKGRDQTIQAFGINFRNPVGLAAGYDKDGLSWLGLATLGFGHIEVGTVTPRPQPGNPKPRVFRLIDDQAVINRMGFPGKGAAFVARQLIGKRPAGLVLGVNIGKNKDTPNETAVEDYRSLVRQFAPLADYLAINISSPNTVGLRRLQARDALEELLRELELERQAATQALNRPVPMLVKLAPDLTDDELDDALAAIQSNRMDGIIASNTTVARPILRSQYAHEAGGLSGAPLTEVSREMVSKIHQRMGASLPIIGVGGIMTPDDAHRMLDSGAVLIQVYTGMIYAGPGFVKGILETL